MSEYRARGQDIEEVTDIFYKHVTGEAGVCNADRDGHEWQALVLVADDALQAVHDMRAISTVAELDALPGGSVVLDSDDEAFQRVSGDVGGGESLWSGADLIAASLVNLPATVLHYGRRTD